MNRIIIADIKSPVCEGKSSGHFFTVAENYYDMFHNEIPTIIAGGPIYNHFFSGNVLPLPYNVELRGESKIKSIYKYFCNAGSLFRNCSNDIVIVQQGGDATFFAACLLQYKRKRNNKLFLIQYSTASLQGLVKRLLFRLARRKIDGIICPNKDVGEKFNRSYCVVPDYIYTGRDEQYSASYEEKKYDICFLGRIVKEKGIDEFLSRFVDTPYRMLVAGRMDDPKLALSLQDIVKGHENVQLYFEYLSRKDYQIFLRQSRFCVLNYKREYSQRSSGVVLDMIFNDVPIIGSDCTALNFVKQYDMGYIFSDLASLNLEEIISPEFYYRYVSNIARYKQMHVVYKHQLAEFLTVDKKIQ